MSVPDATAASQPAASVRPYWLVFLVRAFFAAVVALAVTFSANHSAPLGFVSFGLFALASGLTVGISSWRMLAPGVERSFLVADAIISVVLGVVALLAEGSAVAFLLFILSAWAIFTGVLELYAGVRSRRHGVAQARDWIFAGGLTVLFAIAILLVPASYSDRFIGPDGVARVLTASVVSVGLFGAYTAILAVYLVIAALSLKWGTQRTADPVPEGNN